MTVAKKEKVKHAPAYVSSGTFSNFVKGLSAGLPHHIDKSLMPNLAGGTQGHLIASLKFLGLIEDDGEVTSKLKALVDAVDTDDYQAGLKAVINSAYAPILGDLTIVKATPKVLHDKFREAGATGSTNTKAVRFYIACLKECGVEVPKHLSKTSTPRTSRRRPNTNGQSRTQERRPKPESDPPAKGTRRYPLYFKGKPDGALIVPEDLTRADCTMIRKQLEVLEAYAGEETE